MLKLSPELATEFYPHHVQKPYFREILNYLTSDVVVGFEVVGINAIENLKALVGPANPQLAKEDPAFQHTLRAYFGTDTLKNAVHCSANQQEYERESRIFFGEKSLECQSALFSNCSLAIIKPHLLQKASGNAAGVIIDRIIDEGFEISALEMFNLDRAMCDEFFGLYKGLVPEYQ